MSQQNECKHDNGFTLGEKAAKYMCRNGCGFSLIFDPDVYPEGVAFVEYTGEEKMIVHKISKW